MSHYGGSAPGGVSPYPQGQGSSPYPNQDALPQLQKPGQASAPSATNGSQQAPSVGSNQGQAPYPGQGQHPQGHAPYPGQGQAPQGQAPYPGQGQTPYPGQGQTPYPGQGQTPYPGQGQTPYPGQGQTPYPGQGQTPYPGQGQTPYPGQGQTPYPGQGQTPYPGQGQTPYPGQGQTPYPGQGQTPYPGQGQTPYPGQGQTPYPGQSASTPSGGHRSPPPRPTTGPCQGQTPYSGQGQTPYPGQGQTPYPGQGQTPYPGQGQTPNPGQGQAPYSAAQTPHSGQGQAPYPGQVPQSQASYAGQGQPYQSHGPPVVTGQGVKVDEYKSRVEIRLECKKLINMDYMSKSDPCAVLYMMQGGQWMEVGRTENIQNCLDPKFTRSFIVNYFFEEVQKVMVRVYDIDNSTPQLDDDDFLGQTETTLGQMVSNTPMTSPLYLKNGRKTPQSTITFRTEELKKDDENVLMTFRAAKLDKKDFFGKSDPYLEISKVTQEGTWQVVHRTEVIKNNLNPSWRPFELTSQTLCGGNRKQNIKFDIYDWDSDGSHDYIGGFVATVDEMMKAQSQEVMWPCINQAKKSKKKGYNNSGCVYLTSCHVTKVYSFLDYIIGGMQINFTVGIDFTGSNGNPTHPQSLHYINPHQPNEYMTAIRAVGDVCQDYDSDKLFPVLGFGAKVPPTMNVSHEFAVNFNPQNPYCAGIDGILAAYYNCIQKVQLYGPTNAAPIINHVAAFAQTAQKEEMQKGAHAYYILLLLTDGVLSDMANTKRAIVLASKLPMSLIIVGVGNADFGDMEELDGDDGTLRSPSGEPAKRDIVQFVPYRQLRNASTVELARHVLAEVPKQVTDYYKMRRMGPNKKAANPPAE